MTGVALLAFLRDRDAEVFADGEELVIRAPAGVLTDDLRGRVFVPMHWGTFALNREPFREPPDRLLAEALKRGEEESIALLSQGQSISW